MTLEIDFPQSLLRPAAPAGRVTIVHCGLGLNAGEPGQKKKMALGVGATY
jgi:hypothetical protein